MTYRPPLAQVEFSPTEADKPKWNARGAKVLDGGAEALEEALRLSLQPELGQDGDANAEEHEEEGGKRKLKEEGEGPPSKKRKSNEEGEEGEAGEDEEDMGLEDIYASVRPPVKHNQVARSHYKLFNVLLLVPLNSGALGH